MLLTRISQLSILALLCGRCLVAQGFVYPIGNTSRRPTTAAPNANGYKITQGFNNDAGHTGVNLANGSEGGDIHAIGVGTVTIRETKPIPEDGEMLY